MNEVNTNPITDLSAYVATLNGVVASKDHALYAYGFVYLEGNSGDPRYGESGVTVVPFMSDIDTDVSYSYKVRLKQNTAYRAAALAVDGTTMEFFYGETIDLVTPAFIPVTFPGTVAIEGVPWTGLIKTIGNGKEFPSFYEAAEYVNALEVPCAYVVYDDFDLVEGSYFRQDAYIIGVGSPVVTIKSGFSGRSGMETLEDLTKFYMDNIAIVVDSSISWSRRLIEDWNGGVIKFNKVKLEIQNSGGGADLFESCETPTLHMQNVTLNIVNIHEDDDHHANVPSGVESESVVSKVAYNSPWKQHGLDGVSVDNAVIGSDGYGYEYGTAGALIQIGSTPAAGKKVMVRK
ncbi:MAG: hypothetical protein LLG40_11205 [Deltaproteobacteria bacterium]|nr:hypothetical protein [Deltaproteobacteria bacterium]